MPLSLAQWKKLSAEMIPKFKRFILETPEWDTQSLEIHRRALAMAEEACRATGERIVWVTVNPEPSVTFKQLETKVDKAVSKAWIESYAYAYEFRKLDNNNNGLHVHILLRKGEKRQSEVIREVTNTFKSLVGIPDKHIDIRFYDYEYLNDKMDYLNGIKYDDDKKEAIELTKKLRTEMGIENVYKKNI